MRPEASVTVPEMIDGQAFAGLLHQLVDREDRGLGIERVEDRLDQEEVCTAVQQTAGLLQIGVLQLVEAGVACAGVVDVRAD
jgi:hypothetical protein